MKRRFYSSCFSIAAALGILSQFAPAASSLVRSSTGVPYDWGVTLGSSSTDSATGFVGAWSWDEDANPVTKKGWTHLSNWIVVTLNSDAQLTLRFESQAGVVWHPAYNPIDPGYFAGVDLKPSFSLYQGSDTASVQSHQYNNRGEVSWAPSLTLLDYADNYLASSVEKSWNLPAGTYTIALGGNSPAATSDSTRQGYQFTLSTSPVPEPAVSLLTMVAVFTMLKRSRKF